MTASLFDKVVAGGYCIGCGACAATAGSGITISLDEAGRYRASANSPEAVPANFAQICPFSGTGPNENLIAAERFVAPECRDHDEIGRHVACFAGHALSDGFRSEGSSGGLTTWLLAKLVEERHVDGVIHVGPECGDSLFRYRISTTVEDLRSGAKSRYYPVEMSGVLAVARESDRRFALVGVPCFVKAAHRLMRAEPDIRNRIVLTVGIFCGHFKSTAFADYLATQVGVPPEEMRAINFRHKYADKPASSYGVAVTRSDGSTVDRPMSQIYGGNWGYGFFKYQACNYCDDVTAETADVAFGDAWLPQYVGDSAGTNVVVVRNPFVRNIMLAGQAAGEVHLEPVDAETVALSQAAGLRDRREGLSYRLWLRDAEGAWRPEKRVEASDQVPANRRKIYELRECIARSSHQAFANAIAAGKFAEFQRALRPMTDDYDACYRPTLYQRTRGLIGRMFRLISQANSQRAQ